MPFNFVARDLMNSETIEQALKTLSAVKIASGFSLNIASIHEDKKIYNVEIGPGIGNNNQLKIDGNYSHTNEYKRLNAPQLPDPSSFYRTQRIGEFPIPKTVDDARAILGDTMNKQYPIYRNGNPPDADATVITAIFDLVSERVLLFTENPKLSKPLKDLSLNLWK